MRSNTKRALAQFSPIFSTIVEANNDRFSISNDLFSLEKVLSENSPLLRAITDPSRDEADKKSLVEKLFSALIDKSALEIVNNLVGMRWSENTDFLEALETLGLEALILQADKENKLHVIEGDLFSVANMLRKEKHLRNFLCDVRTYTPQERVSVLEKLFANRVDEFSLLLLKRAVIHTKRTGLTIYILNLAETVATHTNNLLATVSVITPMSSEQKARLEQILYKAYGKQVVINEIIDKDIIGGVRIRIGETIIDGSLLSTMEQVRQRLAS